MRILIVIAAGLLAVGAAHAQTAPPVPSVIRDLDWLRKPTGEDVDRLYPVFGKILFLDGQATMQCVVAKQGLLADCKVVTEAPTGVGFGAAALTMADRFQMRDPTMIPTADGEKSMSPEGGTVRIPLTFRVPYERPKAALPSFAPKAPDAKRVLAARAMEAEGRYHQLHDRLEGYARGIEEAPPPADVSPEVLVEVGASFKRAVMGLEPDLRREIEDVYASVYTDDELRDRAAHPRRDDPRTERAMVMIPGRALMVGFLAASTDFCAKHECPKPPAAISEPSSPPPPGPR